MKMKQIFATLGIVVTLSGAGATVTPVVTAQAKSYVVIAPRYGRKSHHSRHCRGLNAAKSTKRVSWKWAKHHNRPLCHWCYR